MEEATAWCCWWQIAPSPYAISWSFAAAKLPDWSLEPVAMRRKKPDRELQRVVKRVLPLVPADHQVGKAEFEEILAEVVDCVHEKTGVSREQLSQLTARVVDDLPNEYGRLAEDERSWPTLIAYLYSKYLRELGAA
jgi:hypothetical protein